MNANNSFVITRGYYTLFAFLLIGFDKNADSTWQIRRIVSALFKISLATRSLRFLCVASVTHFLYFGGKSNEKSK